MQGPGAVSCPSPSPSRVTTASPAHSPAASSQAAMTIPAPGSSRFSRPVRSSRRTSSRSPSGVPRRYSRRRPSLEKLHTCPPERGLASRCASGVSMEGPRRMAGPPRESSRCMPPSRMMTRKRPSASVAHTPSTRRPGPGARKRNASALVGSPGVRYCSANTHWPWGAVASRENGCAVPKASSVGREAGGSTASSWVSLAPLPPAHAARPSASTTAIPAAPLAATCIASPERGVPGLLEVRSITRGLAPAGDGPENAREARLSGNDSFLILEDTGAQILQSWK